MRTRGVILSEQGETIDRTADQMWDFAKIGEREAFDKWATDLAAGAFGRGFEFCQTHHGTANQMALEARIDELKAVDAVEVLNSYRSVAADHLFGDPYLRGYHDGLREVSNGIKARIEELTKQKRRVG